MFRSRQFERAAFHVQVLGDDGKWHTLQTGLTEDQARQYATRYRYENGLKQGEIKLVRH